MFHQSGGCCDGSSPMCYPLGEFMTGDQDVLLGTVGDAPFYIGRAQFEYWKHTQIILDVVPGRGGIVLPRRTGGYSLSYTITRLYRRRDSGAPPVGTHFQLTLQHHRQSAR
ncbi:MAG: DUF779 domain-containing protein [Edaphobacter sp.]|uniref:DUF779 domain-containing protein n=1 Tax=Edaphobacter sp. TaxID=1934404 RepID=UPI00238BF662|nr:DUF779 domain-containing protein [Edaphobacter sp.]MDE1176013.1 DUF779 domain-containing protein [Edaphobacter sp.]